jgi:hypothetical protein
MQNNKDLKKINDRLEKIIDTEIKNQYIRKFLFQKEKINLKSIFYHLKDEIGFVWLKEKPFMSKARKIHNRYKQQLHRIYTNKDLVKLQKNYPTLQIFHTYAYFVFTKTLELKKSDIEKFKLGLEILFKIVKAKKSKDYEKIKEKHNELTGKYISNFFKNNPF